MLDNVLTIPVSETGQPRSSVTVSGSRWFWFSKRSFDLLMSLVLLPVMLFLIPVLLILNPFFNKGRLFFVQERMGRHCKPFRAIKFRTMTHVAEIQRKHDEPIEIDRITLLGRFLRRTRLDEVPQILNVLKGEMSLIGPRPDYYEHAVKYAEIIPGYRARHAVRPGVSGLAQVGLGYAEGIEATRAKTAVDHYYIEHAGFRLDSLIVLKTIQAILFRAGA